METVTIPLSSLRLDGGTQQRELSDETINHYVDLLTDGSPAPPVAVMFDGSDYWLYDGFHRVSAALKAGHDTIDALVEKGTCVSARWKSFGVNSKHGKPLTATERRAIIEKILTDKSYEGLSVSSIAKHVGVSRTTVHSIKKELEQPTGDSEPETQEGVPETVQSEQYSTEIEPTEEEAKEDDSRTESSDEEGREIPRELEAVFGEGKQEILGLLKTIKQVKAEVERCAKGDPRTWHYYAENRFRAAIKNLMAEFKFMVPTHICPYCGGTDSQDCKACGGCGFLNAERWNTVPKEMKGE